MLIIGAGLSGLIAATQFPQARIIDSREGHTQHHKALLRFRSPDVGKAVGIPFREVKVYKAVFADRLLSKASIAHQNAYSMKVTGRMLSRSISDLRPVKRWVAPDDFADRLYEMSAHRIAFRTPATKLTRTDEHVISTMPMNSLADIYGDDITQTCVFNHSRIVVQRFLIPNADVYQTIYYPDSSTGVYRASITGDLLIVESIDDITNKDVRMVAESFGIIGYHLLEQHTQKYGKISPIDEARRQAFIMKMTLEHNIFSLGRFAVWRNILLDDMLIDIEHIKSMIQMGSYHRYLRGAVK